jgi:phage terminase large subunit-like protein
MAAAPPASRARKASARRAPAGDRVAAYARAVIAGEIVTGKLVRMACERHLRDLREGPSRGLRWDPETADRAIDFFGYLRQSKGRWANQPLTLQPWQQFVIGSVFGWKRWDPVLGEWTRRFRRALVELARKNGKTTLAGGVGIYLVDFDDEPGAEVYAAATKRDQARICWDEAARMVSRTPALKRRFGTIPSRANLHIIETASKFEALGADSDSTDGLNVHGALIDELHAHRDRKLVDVLETATGARTQPLFFYITTAGVSGVSIYQEIHDYATRVAEGLVDDDEWFVYIAALDREDDWTDPANYIKANPSLGVTVQIDELIKERDRAVEVPGRQNAFKRLRLNIQTEQVDRWIDLGTWDACRVEGLTLEAMRGRRCYAGIDLSTTTDVTAVGLLFPATEDDGEDAARYAFIPQFWVPAEGIVRRGERDRVPYAQWRDEGWLFQTEGDVVDQDAIKYRLRELAEDFALDIVEVPYDRWNAGKLITELQEDGLTCVPIGQGYASLSSPTKELERLLLAGDIAHDGNPVMRWMVGNVAVEQDAAGNVKPSKAKSTERIDGVITLVMDIARADVSEEPESPGAYV